VAVGFQLALILGQANVTGPQTHPAATGNRLRCLTYALAIRLVTTLDGPPSRKACPSFRASRPVRPRSRPQLCPRNRFFRPHCLLIRRSDLSPGISMFLLGVAGGGIL
jgi:hypothetical protein